MCGPFWAGAIQGKSRKEEMMASPSPASAPSCPPRDNSERGTSLPQGQSPHPGSESLPDNFLYGAFPSLQGLHLPLLHWSLPPGPQRLPLGICPPADPAASRCSLPPGPASVFALLLSQSPCPRSSLQEARGCRERVRALGKPFVQGLQ